MKKSFISKVKEVIITKGFTCTENDTNTYSRITKYGIQTFVFNSSGNTVTYTNKSNGIPTPSKINNGIVYLKGTGKPIVMDEETPNVEVFLNIL